VRQAKFSAITDGNMITPAKMIDETADGTLFISPDKTSLRINPLERQPRA
jgi:hypothetical protein